MGNKTRRKRKRIDLDPWQPLQNAYIPEDHPDKAAVEGQEGFVGIFRNNLYQVTMREYADDNFGTVSWLIIRRLDAEAMHDWRQLQRIKNELCGPEREGIELYPAESRLVDESNQHHLFVMGKGVTLPLGYKTRRVGTNPGGANKQRPFNEPPKDLNADTTTDPHATAPAYMGDK